MRQKPNSGEILPVAGGTYFCPNVDIILEAGFRRGEEYESG